MKPMPGSGPSRFGEAGDRLRVGLVRFQIGAHNPFGGTNAEFAAKPETPHRFGTVIHNLKIALEFLFLAMSSLMFSPMVNTSLAVALIVYRAPTGMPVIEASMRAAPRYSEDWEDKIRMAALHSQLVLKRAIKALEENSCRDKFERWFGVFDGGRYANVTALLKRIASATPMGLAIEYAPANVYGSGVRNTWHPGGERPSITLGTRFFDAQQKSTAAIAHDPEAYSEAYAEYYVVAHSAQSAMWGRNDPNVSKAERERDAKAYPVLEEERARLGHRWRDDSEPSFMGVIIHELSHCVAGAIDNPVGGQFGVLGYGSNLALLHARKEPHLAVNNADNIRLFPSQALRCPSHPQSSEQGRTREASCGLPG